MTTREDAHGPDYFTPVFLLPQLCNSTRQGPEPVQGRAGECRARWDWTRSPRASVVNGGRAQFWVRWNPG